MKAKAKTTALEAVEKGFNPLDFSVEKRIELANKDLQDIAQNALEKYKLQLNVEMVYSKQGAFPRLIWQDVKGQEAPVEPKVVENENADQEAEA